MRFLQNYFDLVIFRIVYDNTSCKLSTNNGPKFTRTESLETNATTKKQIVGLIICN
jgi:hypothetical protein